MLTIRLSRIGKKKKPMYRLVISENAKDTQGRALEILGSYNPFTKELTVEKDRIEHWIANGSKMSPSVNNLLIEKNIIKGEKVTASKKGKPKEEEKKEEEKKEESPAAEGEEAPAADETKEESAPASEEKKEEGGESEDPSASSGQGKAE